MTGDGRPVQRPVRRGVPIARPAPDAAAPPAPARPTIARPPIARPASGPPVEAEAAPERKTPPATTRASAPKPAARPPAPKPAARPPVPKAPPREPPPEAPSAVLDSRVARSAPSRRTDDDDAVGRSAKRVAWITVAVVVALGALVFFRYQSRLAPPRVVEAADRSAPAPARPAAVPVTPFDVLSEPSAVTSPIEAPLTLGPPFDVIDATTFRANEVTVRLGRVVGTRRGDVCLDAEGLKFACGLMGRAALANYLKTNRLVCHRLMSAPADRVLKADCWLGEEDISLHQVEAGFARPDPLAGADLVAAARAAEKAGVGAWRGGWTLVPLTDEQRDGR
jgi:endonuclease YncB( thermonuclease family)